MTRGPFPAEPAPGECEPDAFVNAWVGTPFKWDGRDRRGVDCWGLVWRFYRDCLGAELPDWRRAGGALAALGELVATKRAGGGWHAFAGPRDGAIVIASDARGAAHTGIVWRGGVLHAKLGAGVVWESLGRFVQANPSAEFGEWRGGADG